jgi:phenylacetic acid degradation operon negative regulatory protein
MREAEPPELPRWQSGSSPQHLLTTLLGDYWLEQAEPLPSAALVALLGEFGIGTTGARAALSRLAHRGIVVNTRLGRHSFYGIAPTAADLLRSGARRFVTFGHHNHRWDGHWTIAAFSLAGHERAVRYTLQAQLHWLGFAPLYDALRVSPRSVVDEAHAVFDELGVHDATIFRATAETMGGRHPIQAWNLDELAQTYSNFLNTYRPLRERVHGGQVSATEALLTRTRIMDDWRRFPQLDPDLPAELLPKDWPRTAAHDLFVEVYDGLAPLATIRVRQLIRRYALELADLAQPRTTAQHLAAADHPARRLETA